MCLLCARATGKRSEQAAGAHAARSFQADSLFVGERKEKQRKRRMCEGNTTAPVLYARAAISLHENTTIHRSEVGTDKAVIARA